MLFPWLYEEMDKEIAKAKPITDINIDRKDIQEQIPVEFTPISEPSTSEPTVPSEPTTSTPPIEPEPSTTIPHPGKNVSIGVSDSVVATDK